jgi:hypothetical protein
MDEEGRKKEKQFASSFALPTLEWIHIRRFYTAPKAFGPWQAFHPLAMHQNLTPVPTSSEETIL